VSENLVSKFAFSNSNVYRYTVALAESPRWVQAEMARDDDPVRDFHLMNLTGRNLADTYGLVNGQRRGEET
jgi:hypothetical protein